MDIPAVGRSDDDGHRHRAHLVPAAGPAGLAGAEVRTPDETVLGLVGEVVEVVGGDAGMDGTRWASVVTGDDGGAEATVVVPLANTVTEDDVVRLPFGGQTILGAPRPADPESITAPEHADLESYYGAFTSPDSDKGWVMPQDLPDVPFILEETLRDATTPEP
jgi:hypothetical protein